jgi:prolyl oligopeptidase
MVEVENEVEHGEMKRYFGGGRIDSEGSEENGMKRIIIAMAGLVCGMIVGLAAEPEGALFAGDDSADPYLWLEEIDGKRALAWVERENERTRGELGSSALFKELRRDILEALNSASRTPDLTYHGERLYNLWRDAEHPRGLFRRTTLEELRRREPLWTQVLDIDELSWREGKQWVLKGMTTLPPEHRRALVVLSPGGGDAVEVREFDLETLEFVKDGFFLPTAKSEFEWVNEERIFVATDFGPGSLTEAGYPRVVKIWKRGTPLEEAEAVYEGSPKSSSVGPSRLRTAGGNIDLINERKTFWTGEYWQLADGEKRRLELPETAQMVDGFQGKLVIRLHEDWRRGATAFKAGSVLLADPAALRGQEGSVTSLVEPSAREVIGRVVAADHQILLTTLENARGRLHRLVPSEAGFTRGAIELPDFGAVSVMSAHGKSGDALALFQSFTAPPTLYHVAGESTSPERLMSQRPAFDGEKFETTQEWAVSKDGTRIPYFVVGRKGFERDGSRPTHIFSYGGFRIPLTPSYSGSYELLHGAYGKAWLERGGVFVLANIRGGGEFGPEWHSTVLKHNRHKVYEDFEAVAEQLVKSGVTSRGRIGIEGRSNGGLLTLAAMVREPELYGAVISGVPLADMRRYHLLLAGASWIAEFGDPRVAEDWAEIGKNSPYQKIRGGVKYPPVFVYTSTRDDRVHPGHARKVVARLRELGHEVWYYENTEGGHGGSSTNEQLADRVALSYAHLWRALGSGQANP